MGVVGEVSEAQTRIPRKGTGEPNVFILVWVAPSSSQAVRGWMTSLCAWVALRGGNHKCSANPGVGENAITRAILAWNSCCNCAAKHRTKKESPFRRRLPGTSLSFLLYADASTRVEPAYSWGACQRVLLC